MMMIAIFSGHQVLVFYKKYRLLGIKGFDDDFAHQEEIDLCWRALNKGHK
jgi:GT2 family glycosyltransferase